MVAEEHDSSPMKSGAITPTVLPVGWYGTLGIRKSLQAGLWPLESGSHVQLYRLCLSPGVPAREAELTRLRSPRRVGCCGRHLPEERHLSFPHPLTCLYRWISGRKGAGEIEHQ